MLRLNIITQSKINCSKIKDSCTYLCTYLEHNRLLIEFYFNSFLLESYIFSIWISPSITVSLHFLVDERHRLRSIYKFEMKNYTSKGYELSPTRFLSFPFEIYINFGKTVT